MRRSSALSAASRSWGEACFHAADCPAVEIYTSGVQASEFSRTVSRLMEMRSHEYLESPHRRFETHAPVVQGTSTAAP